MEMMHRVVGNTSDTLGGIVVQGWSSANGVEGWKDATMIVPALAHLAAREGVVLALGGVEVDLVEALEPLHELEVVLGVGERGGWRRGEGGV